MDAEKKEQQILWLSFWAGAAFAVVEFIYAIYSHSQSTLMDAAYDGSELIFIALILFLTPLFHQPISERHPYGFLQVESIFLIIKGFMLLSVTVSISAEVIESALSGGNPVDHSQIAFVQLAFGLVSVVIYQIMKRMDRDLVSPTVDAELLGWKLDIWYSLGLAAAFFASSFLEGTRLAFLAPYTDPAIAVCVVLFMLPENVKMLGGAIKDVFLFTPDLETLDEIKAVSHPLMTDGGLTPVFYDVTRTGRHLWISIYFEIEGNILDLTRLAEISQKVSDAIDEQFENCTSELIPVTAATSPETVPELP